MEQVRAFDIPFEFLSDPINFFQNSPIRGDGTIGRGLSPALPGDKIVLHALMDMIVDMIVVCSACPQYNTDSNGERITDIQLLVRDA